MTTATESRPMADELNAILAAGGMVQVTTYLRSTVYGKKNAGMFFESKDGCLCVRRGKSSDRLSFGYRLMVGIRTASN